MNLKLKEKAGSDQLDQLTERKRMETNEEAIPKKPDCKNCTVRHIGCHGRSCPYGWEEWETYHAKELERKYNERAIAATHSKSKERRLFKKLRGYYR